MHAIAPVSWKDPALWRAGVLLTGFLLPPCLAFVGAMKGWKRKQGALERKAISAVLLGAVVLANWFTLAFYIFRDEIGGVGLHSDSDRFTVALLLFSILLVVLSTRARSFRIGLALASFLLLMMWFSIAYAPQHWLERADFESVTVDQHPLPATMYIGNPRHSEAEAIALLHVPSLGDYFFDFGDETFREASKHEIVALPFGAWTWHKMVHGKFNPPLPFQRVNECRIPLSGGRVLTVTF